MKTNLANAFETTLSTEMGATALTATVATTSSGPISPAYLVIDPDDPAKREYILFDGTFTGTTFVTTVLGNRYLTGSAAGSGIIHAVGAVVRMVPTAQHFDDLWTDVDANTGNVATNTTNITAKANTADVVLLAGSTMTGNLIVPGIALGVAALATTGTVNLDMNATDYMTQAALTGNVIYTTTNRATGRSTSVRIINGVTERTVTFPVGWVFVSAKPTVLAASKTAVLSITAFGTADADVVASWAVQA